jgi:predicted dehydrogenase
LLAIDGVRPGQWHGFSDPKGIKPRDVEYLQRFAERVLQGEPPEITGEDGLAAQAIVEAAYESARTGRAVRVARGPWARVAS